MSYNKVKPAVTEKLIPDPVLMKNLTILSVRYWFAHQSKSELGRFFNRIIIVYFPKYVYLRLVITMQYVDGMQMGIHFPRSQKFVTNDVFSLRLIDLGWNK